MRIGILRAGRVNPRIVGRFGEYPRMVETLLQPEGDEFAFEYWPVTEGGIPNDPASCDGWMITGSRHGVYDDLPWISTVGAFLRDAVEADRPVLGICFGHQLLAHALGGRVEKSDRGWGIGVQEYEVVERPPWMSGAPDRIAFQSIHQDQVVEAPAGAVRVATSDFCPSAMLAYGSNGYSIQAHPEFTPEFSLALLNVVRGVRIEESVCDQAIRTVGNPTHEREFAKWARRFFQRCYED